MVHLEFLAVTLLQGIENLLLVSPMMHLYSKIKGRHNFLTSTVGPTFLETEGMNSITSFTHVCVSVVLVIVPVQLAFYWIYNFIGHPWKRFLQQIYLNDEVQFPGMIGHESLDRNERSNIYNFSMLKKRSLKRKILYIPCSMFTNWSDTAENRSRVSGTENAKIA